MVKKLCVLLFVCVSLQSIFCVLRIDSNGESSNCIIFQSCVHYVNVLNILGAQRARNILNRAYCGFEGYQPKVWCPIPATLSPRFAASRSTLGTTNDFIQAFLDPPVCGFSSPIFNRVIGGENANLDHFPWMALLGYRDRVVGISWMCGGSLISERHVLTAAHCIHNLEDRLFVVRLGELDLARDDEGAHPVDYSIKRMIEHEQYDVNTKDNDIGILILRRDVVFTRSIHPICIPKGTVWKTKPLEGKYPLIAGWGRTSYRGRPATHLKVAQLPVLNNSRCRDAFRAYESQSFDQRVICAGYEGRDSCEGDSGGPLMMVIADAEITGGIFYAVGIISYGLGCAVPEFPGIYTRVTQFLPWIEEKVLGQMLDNGNRL